MGRLRWQPPKIFFCSPSSRYCLRATLGSGERPCLFAGKPAERLREAVDLARAAGAFVELAWAEENLAIGLVLRGEVDEAEQIVVDAIERCRRLRLDQVAYLLAVRGMIETFRGGDASQVPEELAIRGVTGREAEVLRLVAVGRSNAEIAGELVLSVRTVEAHVSSLLNKLNADRRSQLAARVR